MVLNLTHMKKSVTTRALTFCLFTSAFSFSSAKKDSSFVYFYGDCHYEINVQPKAATINLDGISLGHGHAEGNIPCGEKSLQVTLDGYLPHEEFFDVEKNGVRTVQLKKKSKKEHWLFSKNFISQLKDGLGPIQKGNKEMEAWALAAAKKREEDGFTVKIAEVAAESTDTNAASFDGIDFDDVNTWL